MRVLIVDNFDSFTNNLWHLVFRATGIEATIVRNTHDLTQLDVASIDAVIISPGPGHPSVATDIGICNEIAQWQKMPILGVCLGHQLLALKAGADVVEAPQLMHGRTSTVHFEHHWLFDGIRQGFRVVRYHSFQVTNLPRAIKPLAYSEDGVLMALEHCHRPHLAVQFHPESIETECGEKLIQNFLRRFGWKGTVDEPFVSIHAPVKTPCAQTWSHRLDVRPMTWVDPEEVVTGFRVDHSEMVWLDNADDARSQRFSILYCRQMDDERWCHNPYTDELEISSSSGIRRLSTNLFEYIRRRLSQITMAPTDVPFGFAGGLIGALCYESRHPRQTLGETSRTYLYFATRFLVFDHEERRIYLAAVTSFEDPAPTSWFHQMQSKLRRLHPTTRRISGHLPIPTHVILPSRESYADQVKACQMYLRRGESYELCLTTEVKTKVQFCPFDYYLRLRRSNPAPYSGFLQLPNCTVACSSPEKFMSVDAAGLMEAKPIKGTRARAFDPETDRQIVEELKASEKDCAENLMITDLLRHDIGANAQMGTVSVPKNRDIETYASVHQMVSTVQGRLRNDKNAIDAIEAAFPGGSMTGAPKLRSVEILSKIEARERGLYSGSIGYFSICGQSLWNIVIRTAVFSDGTMSVGAGGAVVDLSDPVDEYAEMLTKLLPLFKPLGLKSIEELEAFVGADLGS